MKLCLVVMFFAVMLFALSGIEASAEDDFGCKVLLCMSNPAGPSSVQECVPTMNKLAREMAKPHFKWPKCKQAEAEGSYAVPHSQQFEDCPAGYVVAPGAAVKQSDYEKAIINPIYVHYDDDKFLKWDYQIYFGGATTADKHEAQDYLACGKGYLKRLNIAKQKGGTTQYNVYDNATVYTDIVLAKKIPSGMVVDIYIDGKLYQRVPLNY